MEPPQGVDPRAVVSAGARLASGVRIGAYAVVGDDVELGEDCVLHPHAVVNGPARLGRANVLHSFCSIGGDPQDLKYAGERTRLDIGDRNVFREGVTVSRGTVQGGGVNAHRQRQSVHGPSSCGPRLCCRQPYDFCQ